MPQPDTDSNRVSKLIDDLRDDEVRWNASNALRELSRMNPPPIDALEIALQSDDNSRLPPSGRCPDIALRVRFAASLSRGFETTISHGTILKTAKRRP